MKTVRVRILLVSAVLVTLAAVCYAKVFIRIGGAGKELFEKQHGAETAYQARVALNNGEGTLTVTAWPGSLRNVSEKLRKLYCNGPDDVLEEGDGIAHGVLFEDDRAARLVVLPLGARCMVFRMEQSREELQQSLRAPEKCRLANVPAYAGSNPVFYMKNRDTHSALEVSIADADPRAVFGVLTGSFESAGWRPAFPAIERVIDRTQSQMQIYLRSNEMCCLLVSPAESAAQSVVTVLHKPLESWK